MNCPNCNLEIENKASRCPICGHIIKETDNGKASSRSSGAVPTAIPAVYEEEAKIRARLYGTSENLPSDGSNGEIDVPPIHTYGAKLFQENQDRCVIITTKLGDKMGTGTGFFIKGKEGVLIATNAHVIAAKANTPAKSIEVTHMGQTYKGRVLCANFAQDVALLDLPYGKPDHIEDYVNELGDPHDLLPGDQVFSVGNSRGWGLTYNQFVVKDNTQHQEYLPQFNEIILMNGNCQPGNSGGPIYSVQGQVVGIMSFSPVTLQHIALYLPDSAVLETYMAAAEPGVCGGVTTNTLMELKNLFEENG